MMRSLNHHPGGIFAADHVRLSLPRQAMIQSHTVKLLPILAFLASACAKEVPIDVWNKSLGTPGASKANVTNKPVF